ncbi:MAG TPA: class I SAM-dependent methyltransferase, partial [Lentisphaeria bacterium]|nr:class I SAM-dependent methyltransferase [Lentisphaeria bacterium]
MIFMELSFDTVDHGNGFDFGRAAADYAKYRDIYPTSLYRKLEETGAVRAGLRVLDA